MSFNSQTGNSHIIRQVTGSYFTALLTKCNLTVSENNVRVGKFEFDVFQRPRHKLSKMNEMRDKPQTERTRRKYDAFNLIGLRSIQNQVTILLNQKQSHIDSTTLL